MPHMVCSTSTHTRHASSFRHISFSVPTPPHATPYPHATPPPTTQPSTTKTRGQFLQWNASGIQNSQDLLTQLLGDHNMPVACIQETKLSYQSPPPTFNNYCIVRKDRPCARGDGLITLVEYTVKYQEAYLPFTGDNTIELVVVTVDVDGAQLFVCNILVPPVSSCPHGYIPNLAPLFSHFDDILIMGDFNAHDETCFFSTQDVGTANRGEIIVVALDNFQLMTIIQETSTRMQSNGPCSSPDLTITNCPLGFHFSLTPVTTLNSDHLPIVTDLDGWFSQPPSPGPSCYTKYMKINWKKIHSRHRKLLQQHPTSYLMLHRQGGLTQNPADNLKTQCPLQENSKFHPRAHRTYKGTDGRAKQSKTNRPL